MCEAARKLQVKCHFPKKCSSITDTNDAIFYCSLRTAYIYLDNLKYHLPLPVSNRYLEIMDINYCIFMNVISFILYSFVIESNKHFQNGENITVQHDVHFVIVMSYDIKCRMISSEN